jgi:hypothetical protein
MAYSKDIVTNPGAVLQNTIQPVADDPCLTLRPFSDAQTSPVLRVQNAAGSNNLVQISGQGVLTLGDPTVAIAGGFNGLRVVGTSGGGFFSTDATVTLMCKVNAGDKSFFDSVQMQAYNAAAGTPDVGVVSYACFGTLNDVGTITSAAFDLTDGRTNSNCVQFELGDGTFNRCAFGLLSDSFAPQLYDGQVDIQSRDDAVKVLTLRQHSDTQSKNVIEVQKADNTVIWALAPNGRDWILDTVTGSQIGTSAAQKLILWGGTPVVRPPAYTVSNPTPTRSFDEAAVTLTTLARVLGTLISDIQSWGGVG